MAGKAESGKQKAEMGGHCVAVDPLRGVPGSWFSILPQAPHESLSWRFSSRW